MSGRSVSSRGCATPPRVASLPPTHPPRLHPPTHPPTHPRTHPRACAVVLGERAPLLPLRPFPAARAPKREPRAPHQNALRARGAMRFGPAPAFPRSHPDERWTPAAGAAQPSSVHPRNDWGNEGRRRRPTQRKKVSCSYRSTSWVGWLGRTPVIDPNEGLTRGGSVPRCLFVRVEMIRKLRDGGVDRSALVG